MFKLTGLDLAILLIVPMASWVGLRIGTVSAAFDILGGLIATSIATRFYSGLSTVLHLSAPTTYFLAFALVAAGILWTGVVLSQRWERHFLNLWDRFVGAVLGIVLGLTLAGVALMPGMLNPRSKV